MGKDASQGKIFARINGIVIAGSGKSIHGMIRRSSPFRRDHTLQTPSPYQVPRQMIRAINQKIDDAL